jgi:hypothetical protein
MLLSPVLVGGERSSRSYKSEASVALAAPQWQQEESTKWLYNNSWTTCHLLPFRATPAIVRACVEECGVELGSTLAAPPSKKEDSVSDMDPHSICVLDPVWKTKICYD